MVFLRALAVFLGTVIGVGIFSLPYLVLQSGFFVVFGYLALIAVIVVFEHFIYAEIALGTEEDYRFPGYVGKYLGNNYKNIAFLITFLALFGALLAYLIVGGKFLQSLFSDYFNGSEIFYTSLFFIFGAYFIFRGIDNISKIELFLLVFLFAILLLFFSKSLNFINPNYFFNFNRDFLFFPYGVVLFSLWGASAVPEIEEIFIKGGQSKEKIEKNVKKVISFGIIIAVLTYLLFIIIVYGASGLNTSKEAISGLSNFFGPGMIRAGYIFGIICCFTSFISIGVTLKKIFWKDFNISKNLSWALACFIPFVFFILGAREFIKIIGFTGSLAIGAEGIFAVFLYKKFLKEKFLKNMNIFYYFLSAVFFLGILFEIYYYFL